MHALCKTFVSWNEQDDGDINNMIHVVTAPILVTLGVSERSW